MDATNDAYVISLDAVDLNFLPISQTHRDGGAVPLWSKRNLDLRRKDYYEVVIKSDDVKDENEPVIKNVTCHICDINVPEVYLNEHKNSFRHKFNRKVADTALKRLQLYVNEEDIDEFNEKLPFKHFCTECLIVIDSEEETSHKQTTGHRNALLLERFLNNFLNFYTDDDNGIGDKRNYIKTEVMEESTNFEQGCVSDELNVTETVLANMKKESVKKEDEIETKGAENYETTLNSDELNNKLRPSSNFQDAGAFLEVFDGSNINKFKVTKMCYDAIVITGATSEYCMICNQMFVRTNRLLHVDGELHGQNLLQKSLDNNCIRKINSSFQHCVLCNDYFTEYDLHVYSKKHLKNYRKKIMYKCDKTAQDNDNCNKDNDNCNKDKKDDNTTKYSDILSDENKSSTGTKKNTAQVNKETRNSLVPSTSSSVNIHSKQYCDTCNKWLSAKKFHKHMNSKKHMLNALMSDNHYLLNFLDEENPFCIICQVTVLNLKKAFKNHFTSSDHINKYDKFLKAQSITKIDDKKYYCSACKVYILHKNEYLHIKSKEHADKVGFSAKGKIDEQCDNIIGLVDKDVTEAVDLVDSNTVGGGSSTATDNVQVNANNDIDLETVNELNQLDLVNIMEARREIRSNLAIISWPEWHSDTHPTENVINALYNENTVENRYICDKTAQDNDNCNKDKKYDNSKKYSDVLKSDENKSSTGSSNNTASVNKDTSDSLATNTSLSVPIHPTVFCDTCNVWISTKKFKKHKNTMKHTVNEMSDYHYLMKYLDKENLFCRICKVNVSNAMDDITEHFTSASHVKKYNQLLNAHNIIKIYKKYYCRECKVYMLHKNEYLHIKSKEHTDKVGFSETDEIVEQCDDVTGPADGDATEAVALVDSNTVGGGSSTATDNVQVNVNNDTALESVNQLDYNSINVNPPINTLSEKLESIFHNYLSKIEQSNDEDSDDNDIEIDETSKNSKKKAKRDLKPHFCITCEVQVSNNPKTITEHYRSAKHTRKLNMYDVVNGKLVKKITNLHYQMKITATFNVVECIVCNINLKYSERNVFTHIREESHKSNYKEFRARNMLVLHLCVLFCNACGVKVVPLDEFKHCEGEKHKKNLEPTMYLQ